MNKFLSTLAIGIVGLFVLGAGVLYLNWSLNQTNNNSDKVAPYDLTGIVYYYDHSGLYAFDPRTGTSTVLISFAGVPSQYPGYQHPVLSPDGKYFAVLVPDDSWKFNDEVYSLVVYNVSTHNTKTIKNNVHLASNGYGEGLQWDNDSQHLFLVILESGKNRLYSIDRATGATKDASPRFTGEIRWPTLLPDNITTFHPQVPEATSIGILNRSSGQTSSIPVTGTVYNFAARSVDNSVVVGAHFNPFSPWMKPIDASTNIADLYRVDLEGKTLSTEPLPEGITLDTTEWLAFDSFCGESVVLVKNKDDNKATMMYVYDLPTHKLTPIPNVVTNPGWWVQCNDYAGTFFGLATTTPSTLSSYVFNAANNKVNIYEYPKAYTYSQDNTCNTPAVSYVAESASGAVTFVNIEPDFRFCPNTNEIGMYRLAKENGDTTEIKVFGYGNKLILPTPRNQSY